MRSPTAFKTARSGSTCAATPSNAGVASACRTVIVASSLSASLGVAPSRRRATTFQRGRLTLLRRRVLWCCDRQPEIDLRVQVVVRLAGSARRRQEPQPRWHYAEHRPRLHAAQPHRLAHDGRIPAKLALPEVVTQDDPGVVSGVRLDERAANLGLHAHYAEVPRRHPHPFLRLAAVLQHQEIERPCVRGRGLERLRRRFPLLPLRGRPGVVRRCGPILSAARLNQDELVGVGVRRRLKERPLNQAEHAGRRADTEPEYQDRIGGETGLAAQNANAPAQMIAEVAHSSPHARNRAAPL